MKKLSLSWASLATLFLCAPTLLKAMDKKQGEQEKQSQRLEEWSQEFQQAIQFKALMKYSPESSHKRNAAKDFNESYRLHTILKEKNFVLTSPFQNYEKDSNILFLFLEVAMNIYTESNTLKEEDINRMIELREYLDINAVTIQSNTEELIRFIKSLTQKPRMDDLRDKAIKFEGPLLKRIDRYIEDFKVTLSTYAGLAADFYTFSTTQRIVDALGDQIFKQLFEETVDKNGKVDLNMFYSTLNNVDFQEVSENFWSTPFLKFTDSLTLWVLQRVYSLYEDYLIFKFQTINKILQGIGEYRDKIDIFAKENAYEYEKYWEDQLKNIAKTEQTWKEMRETILGDFSYLKARCEGSGPDLKGQYNNPNFPELTLPRQLCDPSIEYHFLEDPKGYTPLLISAIFHRNPHAQMENLELTNPLFHKKKKESLTHMKEELIYAIEEGKKKRPLNFEKYFKHTQEIASHYFNSSACIPFLPYVVKFLERKGAIIEEFDPQQYFVRKETTREGKTLTLTSYIKEFEDYAQIVYKSRKKEELLKNLRLQEKIQKLEVGSDLKMDLSPTFQKAPQANETMVLQPLDMISSHKEALESSNVILEPDFVKEEFPEEKAYREQQEALKKMWEEYKKEKRKKGYAPLEHSDLQKGGQSIPLLKDKAEAQDIQELLPKVFEVTQANNKTRSLIEKLHDPKIHTFKTSDFKALLEGLGACIKPGKGSHRYITLAGTIICPGHGFAVHSNGDERPKHVFEKLMYPLYYALVYGN